MALSGAAWPAPWQHCSGISPWTRHYIKGRALRAGFQAGPIEVHEAFAMMTLGLFILHSTLRIAAFLRRYSLTGIRGGLSELPGLAGIALMLMSAYRGEGIGLPFRDQRGAVGK